VGSHGDASHPSNCCARHRHSFQIIARFRARVRIPGFMDLVEPGRGREHVAACLPRGGGGPGAESGAARRHGHRMRPSWGSSNSDSNSDSNFGVWRSSAEPGRGYWNWCDGCRCPDASDDGASRGHSLGLRYTRRRQSRSRYRSRFRSQSRSGPRIVAARRLLARSSLAGNSLSLRRRCRSAFTLRPGGKSLENNAAARAGAGPGPAS